MPLKTPAPTEAKTELATETPGQGKGRYVCCVCCLAVRALCLALKIRAKQIMEAMQNRAKTCTP